MLVYEHRCMESCAPGQEPWLGPSHMERSGWGTDRQGGSRQTQVFTKKPDVPPVSPRGLQGGVGRVGVLGQSQEARES